MAKINFFKTLIRSIFLCFIGVNAFAQPTNDTCAGAIPATFINPQSTGCATPTLLPFSTDGTTDSGKNGSCNGNNTGLDQFFTWTATTDGLFWDDQSPGNPGIVIWDAGCGTEIDCSSTFTNKFLSGWSIGDNLVIQIYDFGASISDVAFCLEEFTVPPPPANDDCAGAIPATFINPAGTGCATPTVLPFSTDGTTDSGQDGSCDGSNTGVDQFFTWTATTNGLFWENESTEPFQASFGFPGIVIWNAGCGTEIDCASGFNNAILSGWAIGDNLVIQIYDSENIPVLLADNLSRQNNMAANTGSDVAFCLEEFTVLPPPTNDDCAGAIPETFINPQGTGCATPTVLPFSTDGSTDSGQDGSCDGSSTGVDQFFSWTATTDGLFWDSESSGNPGIVIWNVGCVTEIDCASGFNNAILSGWAVGDNLVIQIYESENIPVLLVDNLSRQNNMAANTGSDVAFCLEEFTFPLPISETVTCGTALTQTHCYESNDLTSWVYTASEGTSLLKLEFLAGGIESNFDSIIIYDGNDNTAPILFSGDNGGDLSGLSITSTGSHLFFEIGSDGPVNCANGGSCCSTPWNWTVECINCTSGAGTAVVASIDQVTSTFTIDVDVTDIGDGTVIISNDAGVASTTVTSTGITNIGPFTSPGSVIITLEHPIESNCNVALPALNANAPFITQWDVTANDQITIPLQSGTYNFDYKWTLLSNPTVEITGMHTNADGAFTTDFVDAGIYELEIKGDFPQLAGYPVAQLVDVLKWGDIQWASMQTMFKDWPGSSFTATDAPDLSNVTSMVEMFRGASTFNDDLDHWEVSNVSNMQNMFVQANQFNGNISNWEVSNVTNMRSMFNGASSFNQDISQWNVSLVNTMFLMFRDASQFNQPIGNWDVSNVTNMERMFSSTASFNQSLGNWRFKPNTSFNNFFQGATSMDCQSWSSTILGWNFNNPDLENMNIGGPNVTYDAIASIARDELLARGWTINGTDIGGDCGTFHQFTCTDSLALVPDTLFGNVIIEASQFITLDSIVIDTLGATSCTASESIVMTVGFQAIAGSDFIAKIEEVDCATDESPPTNLQSLPTNNEVTISSENIKEDVAIPSIAITEPLPAPKPTLSFEVFPNPFHSETQLNFYLPEDQEVSIQLIDQMGSLVLTILSPQKRTEGNHQVEFTNSRGLSGLFYIVIKTEQEQMVKKVVVTTFK